MYYGKIYGMRWGTPRSRMTKKNLEDFKEFERLMDETNDEDSTDDHNDEKEDPE